MEPLSVVKHGYGCDGDVLPGGWFAGVKVIQNLDAEHLEECGRQTVSFREGKTEAGWSQAFCHAPRKVVLTGYFDGREMGETLAEEERIHGPAAAGGARPALAWTQQAGGVWGLMLWTREGTRCLLESDRMLRAPAVTWADEQILVACQRENGANSVVDLVDGYGNTLASFNGRSPALAATEEGRVILVIERMESPWRTTLIAVDYEFDREPREIPLAATDDFNFNPDVAYDSQEGCFYVAWESCPSWGFDERVGLHRNLSLRMLLPGSTVFFPGPGTTNGLLHLRQEAFLDATPHNFTPIHPRLTIIQREPAVAFRRFRFTGFKGFGWDTFLTRHENGEWGLPARVSEHEGPPDGGYALAAEGEDLYVFFPCCDNRRTKTFAEEAAGEAGAGRTGFADNHRVEVSRLGVSETLSAIPFPEWKQAVYAVPPSMLDVAPDPDRPVSAPEGMSLIWGDLHAHTAHSKCMSGNDGVPQDVLRFQRDILGCKVLCLTEHVEYMSSPEFTHVLDAVEAEAGDDCVPVYGVEWAKNPAHHTNFFAVDREVYDKLRALMLVCDHLTPLYQRIRRELPAGSVVAIRHMHGMSNSEYGTAGARVTQTHDPETEWAMEAMQTRGNMMLSPLRGGPHFPTNFLNAGAKIGLIGGSDHSRGGGPNRFCLTGFWVPEVSPHAVLDSLRNRKTLALANGKVAIWATLNDKPIGEIVEAEGPVTIRAEVTCATGISKVYLVRNGESLEPLEIGKPNADVKLADEDPPRGPNWYSVTVEAESAFTRPPILAHASPFFVEAT